MENKDVELREGFRDGLRDNLRVSDSKKCFVKVGFRDGLRDNLRVSDIKKKCFVKVFARGIDIASMCNRGKTRERMRDRPTETERKTDRTIQ